MNGKWERVAKRFDRYIGLLVIGLTLLAPGMGAASSAAQPEAVSACTLTGGVLTRGGDGLYTGQVTAEALCGAYSGSALYNLTLCLKLTAPAAGLRLSAVDLLDTSATAVTVQPLNANGASVGVQKTMSNRQTLGLPENTVQVVLRYYHNGVDFNLLPAGFQSGQVRVTLCGGEAAEGELGAVEATATVETRAVNADGSSETLDTPTLSPVTLDLRAEGGEPAAEPALTADPAGAQAALVFQASAETVEPAASIEGLPSSLPEGTAVALASSERQLSAQTNAEGGFRFDELPAGDYSVYVTLPPNKALAEGSPWLLTDKGDMIWMGLSLQAGQSAVLPDYHFAALTSLQGCAYVDADGSLTRAEGEPLMSGVPVLLQRMENGAWQNLASTVTDEYGQFLFKQPQVGEFRVCSQTNTTDFYVAAVGGVVQYEGATACGASITLADGDQSEGAADIALRPASGLLFAAFVDGDSNGLKSENDRGVQGVKVQVLSGDTVLAEGVTDAGGAARLGGLMPGEHTLRVSAPEGYCFTVKGGDSCVGGAADRTLQSDGMSFAAGETTAAGAGFIPVGSFSGKVFEDLNNDGVMDENDPGVAGVVLRLEGTRTGNVYELTTDETGVYQFPAVADDRYIFTATLPDGMLFARYSKTGGDLRSVFSGAVLSREFSVSNAERVTNKNVGVVEKGVLSGTAFLDLNYNGIFDEGEPGYANVTLEAIKVSNSESMGKTVSGKDGSFRLEGLRGGDYRLRAILPNDGSIFTVVPAEGGERANAFVQRAGRRENSIEPIAIQSGSETGALVGVAVGATISGTVYQDTDYNGQLNEGEKRLSGVAVQAVDGQGGVAASAVTGRDGGYTLSGIMPGTYTVRFRRVEGCGFTRLRPSLEGGSYVVELLDDYGLTAAMEVAMGQAVTGVNAGLLPASTVTGRLFNDQNDNGLWDGTEAGMTGAKVRLLSEDGEIDLIREVSENGDYFFDGVMPGSYTLTYLLPDNVEIARVAEGGNTLENKGKETVSPVFAVTMGEAYQAPLTGAVVLGTLDGAAFEDVNGNGVRDEGEKGLSGVTLTLTPDRASAQAQTVKTDGEGRYRIADLRPALYKLTVALPDNDIFSRKASFSFDPVNSQTIDCSWSVLTSRAVTAIGAVEPAAIEGVIWLDENKDGQRDKGEALMSGITLSLLDEASGQTAAKIKSTEDGFRFENVRPGSYTVSFALPRQSEPAADSASTFTLNGSVMEQRGIVVAQGQKVDGLTTGLISQTSLGGKLRLEADGHTSPVSGVTVSLWKANGGDALQTVVSDETGGYQFDGLWPDEYIVKAELPEGMIFVTPDDPNFEAGASVIAASEGGLGVSGGILLKMARHQLDANIVYIKPAKVGNQAWLDENANGLIDGGEPLIPGVKITLLRDGQAAYETVTDAYGYYLFDQVYPGEYSLQAEAYPELAITAPVTGLPLITSCLSTGDGVKALSEAFVVESGSEHGEFKVGYVLKDGQALPAAIVDPPQRDWSVSNQKYKMIIEQQN